MIQEVVHHRLRITGDAQMSVADARDISALVNLMEFDEKVLLAALNLIEMTGVRGRDAVHVATAQVTGISEIVSTDSDFDDIPGIKRIDPIDLMSE